MTRLLVLCLQADLQLLFIRAALLALVDQMDSQQLVSHSNPHVHKTLNNYKWAYWGYHGFTDCPYDCCPNDRCVGVSAATWTVLVTLLHRLLCIWLICYYSSTVTESFPAELQTQAVRLNPLVRKKKCSDLVILFVGRYINFWSCAPVTSYNSRYCRCSVDFVNLCKSISLWGIKPLWVYKYVPVARSRNHDRNS